MVAGRESNSPIIFFRSSTEFREWLEQYHDKAQELWLGFHKKSSGEKGITYAEALDEALCLGWIDGVRKNIDQSSYTIRFSPRKSRSIWSGVNLQRARELKARGLMQPSGLQAFHERDEERSRRYSYERQGVELDATSEERFRENKKAWDFFQSQPPGYRRTMKWWVISAKKEETRLKRLASLIEASDKGLRADPFGAARRKQGHG